MIIAIKVIEVFLIIKPSTFQPKEINTKSKCLSLEAISSLFLFLLQDMIARAVPLQCWEKESHPAYKVLSLKEKFSEMSKSILQ